MQWGVLVATTDKRQGIHTGFVCGKLLENAQLGPWRLEDSFNVYLIKIVCEVCKCSLVLVLGCFEYLSSAITVAAR
jgi:hypothetical protein